MSTESESLVRALASLVASVRRNAPPALAVAILADAGDLSVKQVKQVKQVEQVQPVDQRPFAYDLPLPRERGEDEPNPARERILTAADALTLLDSLDTLVNVFEHHNPGGTTRPQGEALSKSRALVRTMKGLRP